MPRLLIKYFALILLTALTSGEGAVGSGVLSGCSSSYTVIGSHDGAIALLPADGPSHSSKPASPAIPPHKDPGSFISAHPEFETAIARLDPEAQQPTRQLAERLTWEQAQLISDQGGIHVIQGKQGCEHDCMGCMVHAGKKKWVTNESWEQFTDNIRALQGLEQVLMDIEGRESQQRAATLPHNLRAYHYYSGKTYRLIHRNHVMPFYDSDPLTHHFFTRDGKLKSFHDMIKFLYDEAGAQSAFATSGWNPHSPHAEEAAKRIVNDLIHSGESPYLKRFRGRTQFALQIKPIAKRYRDGLERFMKRTISRNQEFQSRFGYEYKEHGLNFDLYGDQKNAAYQLYSRIFREYLEGFVVDSNYLQDRIANIRTILPAIQIGEASVHLHYSTDAGLAPPFLRPMLTQSAATQLGRIIQDKYFNGEFFRQGRWFKTSPFRYGDWNMSRPVRIEDRSPLTGNSEPNLGSPILLTNGSLSFTGQKPGDLSWNPPNIATHPNRVARSLLDVPIFGDTSRPAWAIATDRLDNTGHNEVTETVTSSIAERTARLLGISNERPYHISVRNEVTYETLKSHTHPVVRVSVSVPNEPNKHYWFDFDSGQLHEIR